RDDPRSQVSICHSCEDHLSQTLDSVIQHPSSEARRPLSLGDFSLRQLSTDVSLACHTSTTLLESQDSALHVQHAPGSLDHVRGHRRWIFDIELAALVDRNDLTRHPCEAFPIDPSIRTGNDDAVVETDRVLND